MSVATLMLYRRYERRRGLNEVPTQTGPAGIVFEGKDYLGEIFWWLH